jgi:SAM-dependent methyltransferase
MEMAAGHQDVWSLVRQHRRMLANLGFYLTPKSRILDFGCGEGNFVYEYRDAGFDAYGFDIRPSGILRQPEDAQFFRYCLTGRAVNNPDFRIDLATYRIPYDDESFDFVFSTSTLEHVQDLKSAFAETSRVLRKGGVAIHVFPPRYIWIEPHIYLPLGGAIQRYVWYLLWASLGIRNEFQQKMTAVECAKNNMLYAKTGLNYPRFKTIIELAELYYSWVMPIPRLWEIGKEGRIRNVGLPLFVQKFDKLTHFYYNRFVNIVLFLQR